MDEEEEIGEIDLGFGSGDDDTGADVQQQNNTAAEVKQEEQPSLYGDVESQYPTGAASQPAADEKVDTKAIVAHQGTATSKKNERFGNVVSISDLNWYTTDIEVEAACSQFGTVKNIKFFEDRSNGRSMGQCVVEFDNHEQAKACIEGLNKKQIAECEVTVAWPGKSRPNMPKNRAFEGMRGGPIAPGMGPPMMDAMGGPMGPMGPPFMGMVGPMGSMGGPMRPMAGGRGPMRPGMMHGGPRGRF